VDESALTGESLPVEKDAYVILALNTPLAERKNCLYSGTFVTSGSAKAVVTAVGDKTEIGAIAVSLNEKQAQTPLQQKLSGLGKTITIIGAVTAAAVFAISIIRPYLSGMLNFSSVQELFVSSIVLIIAAVPEGLPTVVAISLALNMIKLAKENALIKKMTATEPAGAVSVICSDKTGTLTQNKMSVVSVCKNKFCFAQDKVSESVLLENFVCNSTAEIIEKGRKSVEKGSATECALLRCYIKSVKKPYNALRESVKIIEREPFSNDKKYMSTTVVTGGKKIKYIKGAPEVVLAICNLTLEQRKSILMDVKAEQKKARRVLCFAHINEQEKPSYH
jgi:Ca2+-transporting ATPase